MVEPLDREQQACCIEARLGEARSKGLLPWLESYAPSEADGLGSFTEQRVTASPLLLSMSVSVFDFYLFTRQPWPKGLEMPRTLVDLYNVATKTMLQAAGVAQAELDHATKPENARVGVAGLAAATPVTATPAAAPTPANGPATKQRPASSPPGKASSSRAQVLSLGTARQSSQGWLAARSRTSPSSMLLPALRAVFFEAHAAEQRVITMNHVDLAAAHVGASNAAGVHALVAMAAREALPLLTILKAEPRQLQASHLSVQEYFVARSICEESRPLPTPPWQLSCWWAHTLQLGVTMGEPFRLGLLWGLGGCEEGGGGQVENLDLKDGQLGGDRPTALLAVSLLMQQVTALDLSANAISPEEAETISVALATSRSLTSIAVDDHPQPSYRDDPRVPPGGCVGRGRSPAIDGVILHNTMNGLQPVLDSNGERMYVTSCLPVKELCGDVPLDHVNCSYKGLKVASSIILASQLARNSRISSLGIGHNALGPVGMRRLNGVLRSHGSLSTLDVSANALGIEGAAVIADLLRENTVLKRVDLGANALGAEGVTIIAEAIPSNRTLTALSLAGNAMGDGGDMHGVSKLCDVLKASSSILRELNLDDNRLGARASDAIAQMLASNRSLTCLNVRRNSIAGEAAERLAMVVVLTSALQSFGGVPIDALKANDVELLDLRQGQANLQLGAAEALAVCHLMRPMRSGPRAVDSSLPLLTDEALSLRELNLDGHPLPISDLRGMRPYLTPEAPERMELAAKNLGLASCVVIGCLLGVNSKLTELNLEHNNIGAEGAARLAQALRLNTTLEVLSLYNCNLGVVGAREISEALETNRSLTLLRMGANKIGGHQAFQDQTNSKFAPRVEGPAAIALALAKNPVLTTLQLEENNLRAAGVAKILQVLKGENKTLSTLHIHNNQLKQDGAAHVIDMLKANRTLTRLNVEKNKIKGMDRLKLIEAAGGRLLLEIEHDDTTD